MPDDAVRAAVVAELPQVRRSFFDELVALPDRWWVRPAAYLQLSPAYDEERTRAEGWGAPNGRLDDGGHLDTASRATVVAAQLQQLVSTIGPTQITRGRHSRPARHHNGAMDAQTAEVKNQNTAWAHATGEEPLLWCTDVLADRVAALATERGIAVDYLELAATTSRLERRSSA